MESPSARVGKGSEDSARGLLDTVASVAADPTGYKKRLAELDAAQAKALERESAARVAERDAKDAIDKLRSERQALEAERKNITSALDAKHAEIHRDRAKLDADTASRAKGQDDREAAQNARALALDARERELTAKIDTHTKATENLVAEQRKFEAQNAALAKAVKAAEEREAVAAEAMAKMRALLK
jgi:chromosome segregation ATPase